MKIHLPPDVTVPEVAAAMLSIGIRLSFKDGDLVVKERCAPVNAWRCMSQPPAMLEDVLVTIIDEDDQRMTDTGFWQSAGAWFNDAVQPIEPIAWMPLPKPYPGEKR